MRTFWFFVVSLFCCCVGDPILVVEVCRHGDRGPITLYPKDPYYNSPRTPWPLGLGQLTGHGMYQEFLIGSDLVTRYPSLFNSDYDYEAVSLTSTSLDRTVMSAQSQLLSIYQGKGPNDNLRAGNPPALPNNYQPVPIKTIPQEDDVILRAYDKSETCPLLKKRLAENEETSQASAFASVNQPFVDDVETDTGVSTPLNVWNIELASDAMWCYKAHGIDISISDSMISRCQDIYNERFKYYFAGNDVHKLIMGRFINDVVSKFDAKISGSGRNTTFALYSAHDTTLLSVLSGLKMYSDFEFNPPYSARIIFELHQYPAGTGKHAVRVVYIHNNTVSLLKLPDCNHAEYCDLDDFKNGLGYLFLGSTKEWNDFCVVNEDENPQGSETLGYIVGVCLSLFFVLLWLFLWHQRQKKERAIGERYARTSYLSPSEP